MDENTVTKLLCNFSTVNEASTQLIEYLTYLNEAANKQKIVYASKNDLAEAEKDGKTISKFKVEKNNRHMYAVLINKLYGLSGEKKPHEDVVEYWLSLRNKWNGEKNKQYTYYSNRIPFGERPLQDFILFIKSYFDKSDLLDLNAEESVVNETQFFISQ